MRQLISRKCTCFRVELSITKARDELARQAYRLIRSSPNAIPRERVSRKVLSSWRFKFHNAFGQSNDARWLCTPCSDKNKVGLDLVQKWGYGDSGGWLWVSAKFPVLWFISWSGYRLARAETYPNSTIDFGGLLGGWTMIGCGRVGGID